LVILAVRRVVGVRWRWYATTIINEPGWSTVDYYYYYYYKYKATEQKMEKGVLFKQIQRPRVACGENNI
jgi:hypothetical protein